MPISLKNQPTKILYIVEIPGRYDTWLKYTIYIK